MKFKIEDMEDRNGIRRFHYPINPDSRGFLAEAFNLSDLSEIGLGDFRQCNVSLSPNSGTIRGIHYQAPPLTQGKIFVVLSGAVHHAFVSLVPAKPFVSCIQQQAGEPGLLIPGNLAHGFQALVPGSLVLWLVDKPYSRAAARSIRYDDPELGIKWPLPVRTDLLSERDRSAALFTELGIDR